MYFAFDVKIEKIEKKSENKWFLKKGPVILPAGYVRSSFVMTGVCQPHSIEETGLILAILYVADKITGGLTADGV